MYLPHRVKHIQERIATQKFYFMANLLYDAGREAFLDGLISWSTMTIRAVLVDTTQYTVALTAHQWLSDIPAGARIAISAPFTTKTTTAGVAGADNVTFVGVTGQTCQAIAIFRDTGVASTSRLIAWITNAVGLPVTPTGGNIVLQWDAGANRIFKL
jgi:hypothetical protein